MVARSGTRTHLFVRACVRFPVCACVRVYDSSIVFYARSQNASKKWLMAFGLYVRGLSGGSSSASARTFLILMFKRGGSANDTSLMRGALISFFANVTQSMSLNHACRRILMAASPSEEGPPKRLDRSG